MTGNDRAVFATAAAREESATAATLDRIALEIAGNLAEQVEAMYPAAAKAGGQAFLNGLKASARAEVHRWFGPADSPSGREPLDNRIRASAAHRRHMRRMRTIAGGVRVGDDIAPILGAMDASSEQARLDYRAGGPVIEGDA